MKKEQPTPSQERKLKIAEAGILVTLVVALAIFVGVRSANQGDQAGIAADSSAAIQTQETIAEATPDGSGFMQAGTETTAGEDSVTITIEEEAEAVAVAEQAESQDQPEAPAEPVTYAQAEQVFFAGDYEEAAIMFSCYTDQNQGNAWGFYMLGLAEWKAGDGDAAEDAFLHALDLKPDHLKSRVNYARVLLDMERAEEALIQVEMALAVNPNSLDAARVLGRARHNLAQLDLAAESYRAVLAESPEDVWSLNNLGLVLIEQEKFDEALAPLARASLLRDDVACIQNNLGIALERCGHITAAGEAFARALAADAGHAKAAESQARVAGLVQDPTIEPVDLAALAAGFMAPAIGPELEVDMEVASAVDSSLPVNDEPETDGSRNR